MASAAVPKNELRRTALNAVHRAMGARMTAFSGWDMPLEYSGIVSEHTAVRTHTGLFDVSHMGRFTVQGPAALDLLQQLTPNDVARLEPGQAQYSALLNERAGMIDDLVIHKVANEHYILCVNAGRRTADYGWISRHVRPGVSLDDFSEETAQLALQGPRSLAVLQPLTNTDLGAISYYWFTRGEVCGTSCWIARTGYTGEDGFELYVPASEAVRIWRTLLEAGEKEGILPCGLGARNTLRLEAGMLLYGHDMDEDTTPLEAKLGWICKLDKGPFLGQEVLERQRREGVKRLLTGFRMTGRAIARDDAPVYKDGSRVGRVTSGSYVPFLKQAIGLAMLPSELARAGERVSIDVRGTMAEAEIVATPLYRRTKPATS